jgi:hypothetical protein
LGNIHSCWRGHIRFPEKSSPIQSYPVLLLVTNLALANVILGFPWLSENKIFVGGLPRKLLVPKPFSLSEILAHDLPSELMQFKDVFVTNSLSFLPPAPRGI